MKAFHLLNTKEHPHWSEALSMDENSSDDWFTRRFNTLSRVYQTIGVSLSPLFNFQACFLIFWFYDFFGLAFMGSLSSDPSSHLLSGLVYQIFSILFISLVLLAIYRSKVKKNAVVIVFLVTSWFSAWVTLIPILFAEHDIPNRSDTTISNGKDLTLIK